MCILGYTRAHTNNKKLSILYNIIMKMLKKSFIVNAACCFGTLSGFFYCYITWNVDNINKDNIANMFSFQTNIFNIICSVIKSEASDLCAYKPCLSRYSTIHLVFISFATKYVIGHIHHSIYLYNHSNVCANTLHMFIVVWTCVRNKLHY